jgi:hypothetical protein
MLQAARGTRRSQEALGRHRKEGFHGEADSHRCRQGVRGGRWWLEGVLQLEKHPQMV